MAIGKIQATEYASAAQSAGASGAAQRTASTFSSLLKNAVSGDTEATAYDDIFQRASQQYGVPVRLLKAVAKAESGYDPDAVSCCGALGVMQLMPSTARGLGVNDPLDPEQNIMGGAKYLGEKLKQYDGSVELTLAAYNAGSGNVEKYGGVPPFSETTNYIAKVMNYAGMESGMSVPAVSSRGLSSAGSDALGSFGNPGGSSAAPDASLFGRLDSAAAARLTSRYYLSLLQSIAAKMERDSSQS